MIVSWIQPMNALGSVCAEWVVPDGLANEANKKDSPNLLVSGSSDV